MTELWAVRITTRHGARHTILGLSHKAAVDRAASAARCGQRVRIERQQRFLCGGGSLSRQAERAKADKRFR